MKKVLVVIAYLFIVSCARNTETNWYYHLEKNSTEPYGCSIAYGNLYQIFPAANIHSASDPFKQLKLESKKPSYKKEYNSKLFIIVCKEFLPSETEGELLYNFVLEGGNLLICASEFSTTIDSFFAFKHDGYISNSNQNYKVALYDTTSYKFEPYKMQLNIPILDSFNGNAIAWAQTPNTWKTIATKEAYGNGLLMHCSATEVFTNYFLLQNDNRKFYENLLSHFEYNMLDVYWFSKFAYDKSNSDIDYSNNSSDLWSLLKNKEYRNAFLALLMLLALYYLFEFKRRQRIVPVQDAMKNESLAFTTTVGKLYFSEGDHKNLSQKMIKYFIDHARTKYNIKTNTLDENFAKQLSNATRISQEECTYFVTFLKQIENKHILQVNDIKILYNQINKYS